MNRRQSEPQGLVTVHRGTTKEERREGLKGQPSPRSGTRNDSRLGGGGRGGGG